ncbi:MAG: glycosyltransferase family 39 protein [Lachnospiraceae bacterium]|nr:glycosyltransferase family 39 protein [Lachnospiraceae bacterium]
MFASKKILLKAIDLLTLIVLLPLFFGALFYPRGIDFNTYDEVTVEAVKITFPKVFFFLLILFLVYSILVLFSFKDDNKNRIISYLISGISVIVLLAVSIAWIIFNPFEPTADQNKIWTAAVAITQGQGISEEHMGYFDTYPSQKVMAMLMAGLIHIVGPTLTGIRIINVLLVFVIVVGIILCTKEVTDDSRIISVVSILLVSFFPLGFYASFIYGQIAFLAFSAVSLFGVIRYFKQEKAVWLLLPVIFMPVGMLSYRAGIIFFIALSVVFILLTIRNYKIQHKWIYCVVSILLIMAMSIFFSGILQNGFDNKMGKIQNGGEGAPTIALIASAIDEYHSPDFPGGATEEKHLYEEFGRDTNRTADYSKERAIKIILEYINGQRSLSFFVNKIRHQWLDPWFGGVTMTVYSTDSGDESWDHFTSSSILPLLEQYLSVLLMLVYMGVIICQVFRIVDGNDGIIAHFPNIYFLGGFIFQIFWEQKSRYCLPYYLALFPLAAAGIVRIFERVKYYGENKRDKKVSMNDKERIFLFLTGVIFFVLLGQHMFENRLWHKPYVDYSDSKAAYFTDDIALPAGDYGVTLEYEANKDTEIAMYLDNSDNAYPATMNKDENEYFYELHLDDYNDIIHFGYSVENPEDFTLKGVSVKSNKSLFRDYIMLAFFFLMIAAFIYRTFISSNCLSVKKEERGWILLIVIGVLLSSLPLFSGTLFWGADDPAHVMRLEGIKDALMNRQFPVFVFPKNDSGYGLLGYMYPSLFMYIPALLRIMRVSIPTVMNSLYFVFNVITAVVAYYSAREIYEEKEPSYMFAVLYLLLPYRLVNIYNRADVGETLGMCFLPMIIAGMYMCLDDEKRKDTYRAVAYITLGMTAIINSHVLSSALIVGFVVLYALIFIKRLINKDFAKILIGSLLCTILLNAGYIVPFVKLYTFGLNISDMTHKVFSGRFAFADLISVHDFSTGSAWGGISLIGVLGIIIFIVGAIKGKKKNGGIKERFMVVSGIISLVLFLMVPSEFPWDIILKADALKKVTGVLQFAFRFMMLAAPLLVLVTVYYIYEMKSDTKRQRAVVTAVILTAAVSVMPAICNEMRSEPYMQKRSGGASDIILREYWPQGVTDGVFNDDFLFWSSENLVFEGYEKNGLRVDFDYYTLSGEDESIQPPILYYPGYKAVAVTSEGKKYDLGVSRGDYYRVRIDLPAALSGSHVKFYYGGLWYFYIAYAISIISAVVFTVIYIRRYKNVTKLNSSRDL